DLEGQVWTVTKEQGTILISHDTGLFKLNGKTPERIGDIDGVWKIIETNNKPNVYIAATYNGLYPLYYEDNTWVLGEKMKGFNESGRDIIQADDGSTFWVCHGYKGVFKLKVTDNLTRVYALEHFTD